MIEHFISSVLDNAEPIIKADDGAKVMDVLCAVFKSMDIGGWVDFPLSEEIIPQNYI